MDSGEWGKMGSKSDKLATILAELNEAANNGPYTIEQCSNKLNSLRAKCKKLLARQAKREKLYKTTGAETGDLTEEAGQALKVLQGFCACLVGVGRGGVASCKEEWEEGELQSCILQGGWGEL